MSISCSATGSSKLFCPSTGGVNSQPHPDLGAASGCPEAPGRCLPSLTPWHYQGSSGDGTAKPTSGHHSWSPHLDPLRRRMQSLQTTPRDWASPGGGASVGSFRRRSKTGQRGGCGDGRRCQGGSSLQPCPGGHALRVGGAWPLPRDASPRGTHPKRPAALPGPTGPALAGSCG